MSNLTRSAVLAISLLATSAFAQAETFAYSGYLTAQSPTYNRLSSIGTVSDVGTAVAYHELDFTVGISGLYDFVTTTVSHDGFTSLYTAFDPTSPSSNVLAVNDDRFDIFHSGFSVQLTAGTIYSYINTSYNNGEVGLFGTTISGQGTVTVVPEPETYAMLLAGLGLIGAVVRRKRIAA